MYRADFPTEECMLISASSTNQSMGRILDCVCKGLYKDKAFTQLNRPEEAIHDSYDKCEPGFNIDICNNIDS